MIIIIFTLRGDIGLEKAVLEHIENIRIVLADRLKIDGFCHLNHSCVKCMKQRTIHIKRYLLGSEAIHFLSEESITPVASSGNDAGIDCGFQCATWFLQMPAIGEMT